MGLNLGLAALNSYYKEDDARKEREYVQAKRDAEVSTLGDKTEADRTGYQVRAGQNKQGLDLMPGDTEVKKTRQAADKINAGIGLSNAENDQANVPSSLQIKNNALETQLQTSDATLKQLPMKLQQLATQGVLDQRGQSEVVLGTMGQLISRQDKDGAIAFANDIAKVGNILPNTNGKQFTDIQPVRKGQNGAQGDGYNFFTSDGESRFVPVEAITGAMSKLKNGEYQFIHTNDGSVYAGNKQTGAITQGHQGDTKALRSQHTPAEIQLWDRLIEKGVAKDDKQAWEMVRSAREKTRNSFIMDYVAKNAGMGKDATALQNEAGTMYDTLRQNQESVNPSSNSPSAGKLGSGAYDPQINSLIGIP